MPRTLQILILIALWTSGCAPEPTSPTSPAQAEPAPAAPVEPPPAAPTLTENAKIDRLIQAIAGLQNAVFIRNDDEHDAAEAADHLRMKWNSQKSRIKTAEQFIEHLASRSSMSGKPYQIRFADGRAVPAGEWLRERLAELKSNR